MAIQPTQEAPFFEIVPIQEARDRGLLERTGIDIPDLNITYVDAPIERAISSLDFAPVHPPSTTKLLAAYKVLPYSSYWATYGPGMFAAYEGPKFRFVVRQHRIVERLRPFLALVRPDMERARMLLPPAVTPKWMPPTSSLATYWFHDGVEILLACHPTVAPDDASAALSSLRTLSHGTKLPGQSDLSPHLRRLE